MHFLIFILIGAIAGWLAGKVIRGDGFGVIGDIIVGIIGGVLGGWVFGLLGIHIGGNFGQFIIAFVGACLLIWIVRLFKGG